MIAIALGVILGVFVLALLASDEGAGCGLVVLAILILVALVRCA